MSDDISKLQMAMYENLAAAEEWFAIAKRLEAAALTLRQHHPISENPSQDFEDRAQEFMLWGFCIENLMKGLLARKRQQEGGSLTKQNSNEIKYAGPQHNLNNIAAQISFTRNTEETLALEFLSKATIYFGRYPLPTSSKDMTIFWDSRFDDVIMLLLTRLKKKLILPQFCGVGVKPLFYCSTMPAQNEPETYSHSSNASVADCSRLRCS